MLTENVTQLMLNSLLIRKASPPGQGRNFKADGSNLPWVIDRLKSTDDNRFTHWISHLRTALPDLENIRTIEREDDRHRYLMLEYSGGLKVPSWMASDGTLRLMALSIPAYLPNFSGIYLIEKPENGIHPRAVDTMFQIDPELENWIFSDSPEVDAALGWKGNAPPLRNWLENKTYLLAGQIKPARPKEAMEEALRHIRMPRFSSIYGRIARRVSVGRCTDDAFQKLKTTLHEWFPL